eukprot:SAG11_NODE_2764_length_2999_cov_2.267931_3_plen_177_part_00
MIQPAAHDAPLPMTTPDGEGIASCAHAGFVEEEEEEEEEEELFVCTEDPPRVFSFRSVSASCALPSPRGGSADRRLARRRREDGEVLRDLDVASAMGLASRPLPVNRQLESLTCGGEGLLYTAAEGPRNGTALRDLTRREIWSFDATSGAVHGGQSRLRAFPPARPPNPPARARRT